MTNDIQAYTDADLSLKIVLLKSLADLVNAEFKAAKALAAEQYPKGAAIPARSEADEKLGRVTKSDPKPVASVTDVREFEAYLSISYADKLERRLHLGAPEEIAAVLQDHGHEMGDLWWIEDVIPEWLKNEKLLEAVGGKHVPGVTVTTPDGVVSARVEAAAKDLVRSLLSASPVPLLAIEGGQA